MAHVKRGTPILVVDDSPAIRARMAGYLKRLGFSDVSSAKTVTEALEAFRERHCELIFLDLLLGDESGSNFSRRALQENPHANIILMTALQRDHEDVVLALSDGAQGILHKPIEYADVRRLLDTLDRNLSDEYSSPPPGSGYG